MTLQHEYDFDTWFEREYPNREDRQQKFRMSSVRDLMLAAYSEGRRATSGAASGEVAIEQQDARWAIGGAIAYGRMGVNPPPSEDHWLYEYWQIGQQLAKLGETCAWDNVTPIAPAEQSAPPVPRMGGITIKPWRERVISTYGEGLSNSLFRDAAWNYAMAEIADLRALLATQSASTAPGQEGIPAQTGNLAADTEAYYLKQTEQYAAELHAKYAGLGLGGPIAGFVKFRMDELMMRDAARYRWLRFADDEQLAIVRSFSVDDKLPEGDEFDAAIDSAIAALSKEKP